MQPVISIEISGRTTPPPDARARIEFYTQQRRLEFGKFLFQIIEQNQKTKERKTK